MPTPIVLPWPLQNSVEAATPALLQPGDRSYIDFSRPTGEAALVSARLRLVARVQESIVTFHWRRAACAQHVTLRSQKLRMLLIHRKLMTVARLQSPARPLLDKVLERLATRQDHAMPNPRLSHFEH